MAGLCRSALDSANHLSLVLHTSPFKLKQRSVGPSTGSVKPAAHLNLVFRLSRVVQRVSVPGVRFIVTASVSLFSGRSQLLLTFSEWPVDVFIFIILEVNLSDGPGTSGRTLTFSFFTSIQGVGACGRRVLPGAACHVTSHTSIWELVLFYCVFVC